MCVSNEDDGFIQNIFGFADIHENKQTIKYASGIANWDPFYYIV
jgi:hypothetical protein